MSVTLHPRGTDWLTGEEIAPWQLVPVSIVVDIDHSTRIDPGIRLLGGPGQGRHLCGPAFTVECHPPDFGAVVHALDAAMPGDVLVIAANGNADTAMIGEILGGHLRSKGLAGLVCDGAVRDTSTLANWSDFPVFSKHVCPNGPHSAESGELLVPVSFGGRMIQPGELILGDDDGLAIVSPEMVRTGYEAVVERLELEKSWIEGLAKGGSAVDVFGVKPPEKRD